MTVENSTSRMNSLLTRMACAVVALAAGVCLFACSRTDRKPDGPPEKVTIAFSATTDAVLADVAHVKGFFRQEGLDVTPRLHPYGKPALEELLAGKADFATVAETPVMFAIMRGEKIAVIATIQSSSMGHAILARKDRGILAVENLKGKKIAATLGTTSDFFLDAILGLHGVSRKDVEIIDMKAEDMADALARGDIDAVSTFSPYVTITKKRMGKSAITFQDKDVYRLTFNVVAKQDFIRHNPDRVEKALRALVKAEQFVRENPAEAQKSVANFSKLEIGMVRDIWADTSFVVTLDQALILALEDEAEWAIKYGLTRAGKVPNFLDYVYLDGLRSVKPAAVRILR